MDGFFGFCVGVFLLFCICITTLWMTPDTHMLVAANWVCTDQRKVAVMPDKYACSQFTYKEDRNDK